MKVFSYQVRTLGAKPSAFLRSWLLLVLLLGQGALGAKSLPKEAKQKIEQKLANEPKDTRFLHGRWEVLDISPAKA